MNTRKQTALNKRIALLAAASAFSFQDLFNRRITFGNGGKCRHSNQRANYISKYGSKLERNLDRQGSVYGRVGIVSQAFRQLAKDNKLPKYNHGRKIA